MIHQFEPSWSGRGGCARMVDDADLCGQPADHPIHVPNDTPQPEYGRARVGQMREAELRQMRDPALPYAGTSGWSGSETSRSTAVDEDSDGRTLDKQQQALRSFATHNAYGQGEDAHYIGRSYGLTWRELDTLTSWGHGSTSRVLSDLHKAGLLARLSEVRNRCKVYVLPEYVGGRETEPHGGRGGDRLTPPEREVVEYLRLEPTISGVPVLLQALDRLAPKPTNETEQPS